jgi:hypothetical protein
MSLINEIALRSIKLLDIGYLTVIYFLLAIGVSLIIDKTVISPVSSIYEQKSTSQLLFEVICQVWLFGIFAYFVHNLVEKIPFPLQGVYGFDHLRVKELSSTNIFFVVLLTSQIEFINKVKFLYRRLFSKM